MLTGYQYQDLLTRAKRRIEVLLKKGYTKENAKRKAEREYGITIEQ